MNKREILKTELETKEKEIMKRTINATEGQLIECLFELKVIRNYYKKKINAIRQRI